MTSLEGFAQKPESMPSGLSANSEGCFRLDELVRAWSYPRSRERDVLNALRYHLLRGDGSMRFNVDTDGAGHIIVRVVGKTEGATRSSATSTPRPILATPAGSAYSDSSTELAFARACAVICANCGGRGHDAAACPSPKEILQAATPRAAQPQGEHRGLSRSPLWEPSWKDHGGYRQQSAASRGDSQSSRMDLNVAGEKVQRWLAWALRSGDEKLALTVDAGGWASLDALVVAMRKCRTDLGEFDVERLTTLLNGTDSAGRFEVKGGCLRKLDRGERSRKPAPSSEACALAEAAWRAASGGPVDREGARVRQDAAAPRGCGFSGHAAADSAGGHGQGPPSPPPGQGWTQYLDKGKPWWHYTGPCGEWWCVEGSNIIEPYSERM